MDRLASTAVAVTELSPQTAVITKAADVTQRGSIEKAFTEITEEVGKSHILVNSAGVLPDPSPIANAGVETLQSIFSANAFGALAVAQVFLTHAADDPILLNINSGISHMAPLRSMGVYAASKAANAKMFDYLALEHPHLHVVNVQPGVVNTEMNRDGKINTQDEREYDCYHSEGDYSLPTNPLHSGITRSVLRMAGIVRSKVPQRQVRVGQLGRR